MVDGGHLEAAGVAPATPAWVRRLAIAGGAFAAVAALVVALLGGFAERRDHIPGVPGEEADAGNLVFTFTEASAQRTKTGEWWVVASGTVRNPNDEALAPKTGDSGNLAVSAGSGTQAGVLEAFQIGDAWQRSVVPPGGAALGFAAGFTLASDLVLGKTVRLGVFRYEYTDNSVLGVSGGAKTWNPDSAARAIDVTLPLTVLPGTTK